MKMELKSVLNFLLLCQQLVGGMRSRSSFTSSDLDLGDRQCINHILFNYTGGSILSCFMRCYGHRGCQGFQYKKPTKECQGHNKTITISDCIIKLGFQTFPVPGNTEEDDEVKSSPANSYIQLGTGKNLMFVKYYKLSRTWDEALNVCRSDNGRLVKLDTRRKGKEIKKFFTGVDKKNKDFTWIGLRYFEKKEFRWIDGERLLFKNWNFGEPSRGVELPNGTFVQEDCVALNHWLLLGIRWSDVECDRKDEFICEINVTDVNHG